MQAPHKKLIWFEESAHTLFEGGGGARRWSCWSAKLPLTR
jgi:hypothetical protein